MPHISVQMFEGRDERKKEELADAIAQTVIHVLGTAPEHVSVSIQDVPEAEWDRDVYEKFMEKPELLYRKPGY